MHCSFAPPTTAISLCIYEILSFILVQGALQLFWEKATLDMAPSIALRQLTELISLRSFLITSMSCRSFAAAASGGDSGNHDEQGIGRRLPSYDPKYRRAAIWMNETKKRELSCQQRLPVAAPLLSATAHCLLTHVDSPCRSPTELVWPASKHQERCEPCRVQQLALGHCTLAFSVFLLLWSHLMPKPPSPVCPSLSCLQGAPSTGDCAAAQQPTAGCPGATPGLCGQSVCRQVLT